MNRKNRNSSFELMRIICMIMIVTWHVILHGNILDHTTGLTKNLFELVLIVLTVNVNCFALVFGYYQHDKKFSKNKFLSLLFMGWFYKIFIMFIFSKLGLYSINSFDILSALIPLKFSDYWFLTAYLGLYLLTTYVNILLANLSQKQHKNFIILLFFMFSIISTVTNQNTFTNGGCTILNLFMLYVIGAYFNKYPLKSNYHFEKFDIRKIRIILGTIFIFSTIFSFLSYEYSKSLIDSNSVIFSQIGNYINNSIYRFSNPFVIVQSVTFFLLFETFNFNNKYINYLSQYVFGIYLLHENRYFISFYYDLFGFFSKNYFGTKEIIFKVFISIIIIFVSCLIIEIIRKYIFKKICEICKNIKKKKIHQDYKECKYEK